MEKHWPREPGSGLEVSTEIATWRSVSTPSQSVNRCCSRGSTRAGSRPSGPATRTQPGLVPPVAHWYRPAGEAATATSAVPPSAPPGMVTSHEPSCATVTVTVRAARPLVVNVYPATYRLSCAAATRAASCPPASCGAAVALLPPDAPPGSVGGCPAQPVPSANSATASTTHRAGTCARTRSIVGPAGAGSWDRLSPVLRRAGTLVWDPE